MVVGPKEASVEAAPPESAKPHSSADKKIGTDPKGKRRAIPGDFSYTATPGKFKAALDAIVNAERPELFNKDYVESYLGVSGGSASPIPSLMKRIGFLSSDGRPTELYAKFQSDTGRAGAALEGLKKGFPALFKRNTYANTLSEDQLKDLLVEVTGLKKNDPVVSSIYSTYDAVRSFVPVNFVGATVQKQTIEEPLAQSAVRPSDSTNSKILGLSYHINIVLPETKDIAVFNAIFQSLKQNLLS